MSCTSLLVLHVQHGNCANCLCGAIKLNWWKSVSPSCTSISEKSTDRLSILTGVPVFILALRIPCLVMLWVKLGTAGSAIRPPAIIFLPICRRPLRNVPAVTITHFALIVTPQIVLTPVTRLPLADSSTSSSSAWSCQILRLGVLSSTSLHFHINLPLSH